MFGRLKLEMDRLQLSANYYISTFSQQLYIMLFEDFSRLKSSMLYLNCLDMTSVFSIL